MTADATEPLCPDGADPVAVMTTTEGTIVAALAEKAAPDTVHRLVRLIKGPVFDPEAFAGQERQKQAGYYDGLSFTYAHPHIEILTDVRPPGDLVTFKTEIDAAALGLDRQLVDNVGEAMSVVQRELVPAYKRVVKSNKIHPDLRVWMKAWYETHDPAFLIGVSRQKINEALGYVYTESLASLPVTRGALVLKPLSPQLSSARLGIVLSDIPDRTGHWMVIGRVVEGLEVAQAISLRPLTDPAIARSRFRPLLPVRIESIRCECPSR